jgi:hypothetical protein
MQIDNTYTSRDFYLAAFLVATGNELQRHTKDAGNLTTFIFHNSPMLQQQVRKFYALEATINPVIYGNALRNLKNIIHEKQITKQENTYVEQLNRTK